ncbi:CAP-Gly domain protein [Mesorhizobium sp. BR1-1-13]|uniref:CAP-Gly domain protein n=1 Tax=Mesorhizobium sp. BR1-1-13 TaxID=2876656 RepID=UPI001CD07645|nr:CAP-Gly domain protein [Mesorhizobium sp. BR1-1-13]MBZ9943410.1 CAP-Gly domain protein [Mesorhizobium sp. BR1-1-13]
MNTFYVGQQVVCIDDKFDRVTIPQGVAEGQVYTLRWVGPFTSYADGEFIGVRLEGVERGVCPTYGTDDPPFHSRRFRPLVKDPLAIFRRIALDPDYRIDAPEGPLHPDGPLPEERKVKEEVE